MNTKPVEIGRRGRQPIADSHQAGERDRSCRPRVVLAHGSGEVDRFAASAVGPSDLEGRRDVAEAILVELAHLEGGARRPLGGGSHRG